MVMQPGRLLPFTLARYFFVYEPPLMRTFARASCSELTISVLPEAVWTTNWAGCPFLPLLQLQMTITSFLRG